MKQLKIQIPEYNTYSIYKYQSPLYTNDKKNEIKYDLNLLDINKYINTPGAPLPKDRKDIEQFFNIEN